MRLATMTSQKLKYLLGDVPQSTVLFQLDHAIRNSDVMEICFLFVPEERVWNPEFLPYGFAELDLPQPGVRFVGVGKSRVDPSLPQIKA